MCETEKTKRMEQAAIFELLHYGELSFKKKIKRIIKKMIGSYVPQKDLIFWPTGLLANALAEGLKKSENNQLLLDSLIHYFDRWIGKGKPIYVLDDLLAGQALQDLYEMTGEQRYLDGIHNMADYLLQSKQDGKNTQKHNYCLKDDSGSFYYRPEQKNSYIFVDSIGMICPFLCRYGVNYNRKEAVESAVVQIKNMLLYGMNEEKFLPYHGYEYESKTKYGIIGWGRAVGWLMLGMAGVLRYLPKQEKDYNEILFAFRRLTNIVSYYQREDGAFCWQLEAQEGPADTSATAMIAQAVVVGQNIGILNAAELIEKAAGFISRCEENGKITQCSGECLGFAEYPQVYGSFPWSLGPGLYVIREMEGSNSIG